MRAYLGWDWRWRPLYVEGSCDCLLQWVARYLQSVVLQLGSWTKDWKILTLNIDTLGNITHNLGLGKVIRNDPCNGYRFEFSTLELFGLGYGHLVGSCEKGNKFLGSIKYGEFLDYLSYCQLLKKGCSPCSHLASYFTNWPTPGYDWLPDCRK